MVVVKCCSGCGVVKSLDDFHRDRTKPDGRKTRCKECASARQRRYREENRDKVRESQRRHYENNREKVLENNRRYYEENRDKVLESQRWYYEKNREKVLESNRRWRENNRDKVRECQRRWRENNRDKEQERGRRYYEENRDKVRESQRRYKEENREHENRRTSRHMSRCQSVTESVATKRGPWSEAEIAILMADDGRTMVAKALELGRTYQSCRSKRQYLRRTGASN